MPSTSRSRSRSGTGLQGTPRTTKIAPMSERQQLALVMQMTSQNAGGIQKTSHNVTPTPVKEKKRLRHLRKVRGNTALHRAIVKGDHNKVRNLLLQGVDPDVTDSSGWTPLHEACIYNWYPVVVVLVKGGADVNARGYDDDTPLHDAVTSGNLRIVKFLVQSGANPHVKNRLGHLPRDYAAPHIVNYLDSQETHGQMSSGVVSSSQDDNATLTNKRPYFDELGENDPAEDDCSKRKKRKDVDSEKDHMTKPGPARGSTGRVLTGNKPPGPASKTSGTTLGKGNGGQNTNKAGCVSSGSGKSNLQGQGKGSSGSGSSKLSNQSSHHGKSAGSSKGSNSNSQTNKNERKSPVASPKANQSKDNIDTDFDENKNQESSAPKVPPLKIVIPGGASGSGGRSGEQEGEGGTGQRGSGKGRGGPSTLPYVIPCTSNDAGPASDSSDGICEDKRHSGEGKNSTGQRVLRSHRTIDGDKDKDRTSPQNNVTSSSSSNKSPPLSHDSDHPSTSHGSCSRAESGGGGGGPVELHPRKRKIKSSKENHSRDSNKSHGDSSHMDSMSSHSHLHLHSNPYQMYLHIRKQIDRRQKSLFPVKPKPPKDFNKYLMNRCTYTLQSNVNPDPLVEPPHTLPIQMREEYIYQEKERHRLRIQHLVEKEKLVLAVEQEILRVHGRAERAVANQSLPFSVCTMLRDKEVYNVLAPEQEEKRNAQRSRCNGRQINSWLQEVDDKWEKIKEGMLRRQHTEAETLHAVQTMGWEWKLKEFGLCDYKSSPKIDTTHVPQVHVANFDLPA